MSSYVLDASAVLALLNDEPGSDRVRELLPDPVVGAVNACEVVGKLTASGMTPDDAAMAIALLNFEIVPFDCDLACSAGALVVETRKFGLSLGDRACLALGLARKNTVVTAERIWTKVKIDLSIEIIRG
jgi:PIN domain nuclease of toxin-antitoxin system